MKKAISKKATTPKPTKKKALTVKKSKTKDSVYDEELLRILRKHKTVDIESQKIDKDIQDALKSIDAFMKKKAPAKKDIAKKIDKAVVSRLKKNVSDIDVIEKSSLPKKAKADVVEKKKLSTLIDTDMLKAIYDTFTGNYSTRMKNKLVNLIKDEPMVKSLFENRFDFFPTPSECILSMDIDFKNAESLLEPSAGMGMILYTALIQNPTLKTTAYEFDNFLCKFLKSHFPDTNVRCDDFLDTFDAGDYDVIVCNPPFNSPFKNAYVMFLVKCLCIAMRSKNKHRVRDVYFICPPLFENQTKDQYIDRYKLMDIKVMSAHMKNNVVHEIEHWGMGTDTFVEHLDQIMHIGTCQFDVKTKLRASMYHFIVSENKVHETYASVRPIQEMMEMQRSAYRRNQRYDPSIVEKHKKIREKKLQEERDILLGKTKRKKHPTGKVLHPFQVGYSVD